MAGCSRSAKGSLPNRCDSAAHPATAPGTVTASQPRVGNVSPCLWRKYSRVHAAGAGPELFRPCRARPSHTIAKLSLPSPFETGSTIAIAAAAATAASTALPPWRSIASPACAASGCDVATTLRANSGLRVVGYGLVHENCIGVSLHLTPPKATRDEVHEPADGGRSG